jgi:cytochrome c biogenesis protein CcmG/thiol:disulfide interchange protein DsbE
MRRGALRFLALLAAMASLAAGGAFAAKPEVGQSAPPFTLRLVNGEEVSRDGLRGQVVVLNFWATWCAPCKKELPVLDAFYSLTSQHGLRVYAITTEDSVPLSKLKPLMAALRIPFVRRLRGNYDVIKAVPTNYVIDRAGIVRYAKAGAFDLDDLNRILIPLLNEPAPPVQP